MKYTQEFSPSLKYAMLKIFPNMLNGVFWAFAHEDDIADHLDAIKDEPNMDVYKLANDGYVIEADRNFLIMALQTIDETLIDDEDIELIKDAEAEALTYCEEKLKKMVYEVVKKDGVIVPKFRGDYVAFNCLNETPSISHNDKNYVAFRVGFIEFLTMLQKYNYRIVVGSKDKRQEITPRQAIQNMDKVLRNAILSPTNTGIFLYIKSGYSDEERVEMAREQFRQSKVNH